MMLHQIKIQFVMVGQSVMALSYVKKDPSP